MKSLYTPNSKFFWRDEMNPLLPILGMDKDKFIFFMNNVYSDVTDGPLFTLLRTFFKENNFYNRKPTGKEVNSIQAESLTKARDILRDKFTDNTFRFKDITFYDVDLNIGIFTIVERVDKDLRYEVFFKLTN